MKVKVPPRPNMPNECIQCAGPLHAKSEYYCSLMCSEKRAANIGTDAPQFLSKWKLRKRKMLNDPMAKLRSRTRVKTRNLIKRGTLKRKPCVVCGERQVIAHHEDYLNPYMVIWMCELHHKEYHDGKIALFNGRLKWDSARLIPKMPTRPAARQPSKSVKS